MKRLMILTIFLFSLSLLPVEAFAQAKEEAETAKDSTKTEQKEENDSKKDEKKKKSKDPKFEDVIEDFEVIEGFFTLYSDPQEGKVYMEIYPHQFDTVYLCNITRESGDASMFDSGAMLGSFPFFLKRVGKNVQFIQKNVKFRASKDAAISRALEDNISNSLWGSAKIASQPHPERGSILVDPSGIFLSDFTDVDYITSRNKMPYSFDKGNSYFSELKSFPFNTEIEVTLSYKSGKPQPVFTLPDSRNMQHRYHYSLSMLQESDYKPRTADDRVGHFTTIYQDYNSVLRDSPYERYINRWNLVKSEPKFKLSKPQKPIVFWLENTIPVEFRDAVRRGVLLWNSAFEKVGFQEAIEVKQMPDDADWDPADVRYNTVRWIVQPGGGYAVGPSRANPYTGEIYDADIRVSADMIRALYKEFDEFVTPLSWADFSVNEFWPGLLPDSTIKPEQLPYQCELAQGAIHQMAFGWSVLFSRGLVSENSEDMKAFLNEFITHVVAHEVGHTLGLRHNFKASTIHTQKELENKNYTLEHGLTGSVMDYNPVNLAPEGKSQGEFYQTTLGPYDYWAIEYAYKPLAPDSKKSEKEMLNEIASKVAKPELHYGTDEDAFGYSTRGIDPTCNLWDLGSDPMTYYENRTQMAKELWQNIPEKFEKDGGRYQKFRLVFSQGLSEYLLSAIMVPKFIGGIYSHRDHIGDPGGRLPFRVVPAEKQRRALKFITGRIFAPEAFQFSPELLNKLAAERFRNFEGTVWRMTRIDYPIHGIVQVIQAAAMFKLYDPLILQRIQDNELRFERGEEPFTMPELFQGVRKAVWSELESGKNVNSFRRELQRMHLYILNRIVAYSPSILPHDAITLARADLTRIKTGLQNFLDTAQPDTYTQAHFEESLARIEAILNAQVQRSF